MHRLSIVAVVVVAACASKPAPVPVEPGTTHAPPPPAQPVALDRDYGKLAERATQLYRDVAGVFAAAGEDCPAAAQKLAELHDSYADVVAANEKVLHEGRARELRSALAAHEQDLDASARAIVESSTMATCSQDRAFTDAFDDLVGAPP
jgi:hypothetical protein